jgi:rSAM/selenodomain-associated transferase 1
MALHQILDRRAQAQVPASLCALGIMTKAPEPGKVKTRLTPPLTPEEAAQLNICFLRDVAQAIALACEQAPARGVGIFTPAGAETAYANILPSDFLLIPQRGDDFGQRLISAAEDLLAVGFKSVCLINSDSPTIPPASFAEAARELARAGDRIVLGPSDDGGYYLIGLKKMHRRVFGEIDWSTERVLEQTLRRAREISVPVHLLPAGFDVDDRATLHRLCEEIQSRDVATETRKFLGDIIRREGRERIWPETNE